MTRASFEVTNTRQVMAQFRKLGFKTSDLSRAFQQIGTEVAHDAYALAPKVSGTLAGDIRVGAAKTRASIAVGRKSVPYAGPINYGWPRRHIQPSLFMNRAANDKADDAAVVIAREIQRLIDSTSF